MRQIFLKECKVTQSSMNMTNIGGKINEKIQKQTKYGGQYHESSRNLHHPSASYMCKPQKANVFTAKSFGRDSETSF